MQLKFLKLILQLYVQRSISLLMVPSLYTVQLPVSVQVRLSQNKTLLICSTYFLQQAQPCAPSALRHSSSALCLGALDVAPPVPCLGQGGGIQLPEEEGSFHMILCDNHLTSSPFRLPLSQHIAAEAVKRAGCQVHLYVGTTPCYLGATGGRLHPFTSPARIPEPSGSPLVQNASSETIGKLLTLSQEEVK